MTAPSLKGEVMQNKKPKTNIGWITFGFILLLILPFSAFRQPTPVTPKHEPRSLNPYPAPQDEAAQFIQKASENYFYREFKQGADNYRKAIAVYESRDDFSNVAKTYHSLGDLYVWAREPEEAKKNYQLAANFHLQVGNPMGQAEDLMEIGEIRKNAKHYDEAELWYKKSLLALENVKPNRVHGKVQEARGHNHWANNKYDEAIYSFSEAKKVYAHLNYGLGVEHMTNVIFRLENSKSRIHNHAVREEGLPKEGETTH